MLQEASPTTTVHGGVEGGVSRPAGKTGNVEGGVSQGAKKIKSLKGQGQLGVGPITRQLIFEVSDEENSHQARLVAHMGDHPNRQIKIQNLWPPKLLVGLQRPAAAEPRPRRVSAGMWVRVMVQEHPERDTRETSVTEAIPKSCCPICALHARMRLAEDLFSSMQEMAVELKVVDEVNLVLKAAKARYTIREDKKINATSGGNKAYKAPSLNGEPARILMDIAPALCSVIFDKKKFGLKAKAGADVKVGSKQEVCTPADLDLAREAYVGIWQQLKIVDEALCALTPTQRMINDYGKNAARLAIRWHGDLLCQSVLLCQNALHEAGVSFKQRWLQCPACCECSACFVLADTVFCACRPSRQAGDAVSVHAQGQLPAKFLWHSRKESRRSWHLRLSVTAGTRDWPH